MKRAVSIAAVFLWSLSALAQPTETIPNWAAPPYWMPQQVAPQRASEPRGREALATGRQALDAGASTPMPFVAVTPCRVADTRAGSGFTGDYGQPAMQAQVTRTFVIGGQCGIPADAQAVSFLFTAVNITANGNFRAFPAGAPMPTVGGGVLVWAATTPGAVTDAAVVSVGDVPGALNVYLNGPLGSSADLVLDVNGYYSPQGIVNSLNTLGGDITLAPGANVTITPTGKTLTIDAAGATRCDGSVGSGWRHRCDGGHGRTGSAGFCGCDRFDGAHGPARADRSDRTAGPDRSGGAGRYRLWCVRLWTAQRRHQWQYEWHGASDREYLLLWVTLRALLACYCPGSLHDHARWHGSKQSQQSRVPHCWWTVW